MDKRIKKNEREALQHLMNGVTYYNYGVYHQIDNVIFLISCCKANHVMAKSNLDLLNELRSYLEAIAIAGNVPPYN